MAATRSRGFIGRSVLALAVASAALGCGGASGEGQPARRLRIGARHRPPFYFVYADGSVGGLGVDVLRTAAERRGFAVEWVVLTERSVDALGAGRIDVWPTMPIAPEYAAGIHVTRPWLTSRYYLLSLQEAPAVQADRASGLAIACDESPVEQRTAAAALPGARLVPLPDARQSLQAVCERRASAAFVEARVAQDLFLERPPGCEAEPLRFAPVDGASIPYAIASTAEAAGAADELAREVVRLAGDGTLDRIIARWSFTTGRETEVTYELAASRRWSRLAAGGAAGLALALAVAVWQAIGAGRARRQAERALTARQASEDRYRLLVENASEIVYTHDSEGRFTSANRAALELFGYSADEIPRLTLADVIDPSRKSEILRLQAELDAGRSVPTFETIARRKDGSAMTLEVGARPIVERGSVVGVQGIARDVTERKHLEEQLRQAQKLETVGRLAGGVAHDFNNLLTAINGYADLAIDSLPPAHPLGDTIRQIRTAGARAAQLTQQLLAFSRRQMLQPVVLDLNQVVDDLQRLLGRLIGEDVELVIRLSPDVWPVRADAGQLQQVVMNLAVNARDAMPEGGTLTIETANVELGADDPAPDPDLPAGRYVRLRVSDTGHGMDEATLRRAFEPFFTTKELGKGTGLGLSTVYGIVKQSGGTVTAASVPSGGAVFDVLLPEARELPGGHSA